MTDSTISPIAIVVHGGAGSIRKKNISDEQEAIYKQTLDSAVSAGYEVLQNGGSSMDAVETAIRILEDATAFNAGRGSVLNSLGEVEMDASFMDGKTQNAGAVAGVTVVKNPISAAREVLENSVHVMLSGKGADHFAEMQGLEIVDREYFKIERRIDQYNRLKEKERKKQEENNDQGYHQLEDEFENYKFGTVGAAAIDKNGNLAAGTSTGGMLNKRYGRIGDSPVIGAGTYANNATCAVSCTGHGEYFIRNVVAYDISAMMEYSQMSLSDAVARAIHEKLAKIEGRGGVIAVDKDANVVMDFNTPGMHRASVDKEGNKQILIFK